VWHSFPDLSLALAANPPRLDGSAGLADQTEDMFRRFFALLRDHDALAPTTLGVLANRWGVAEPPYTSIVPRVWLYSLAGARPDQAPMAKAFEEGLDLYLTQLARLSITEWINRRLSRKRVIWIRRGRGASKRFQFLSKDHIALIDLPDRRDPEFASWWLSKPDGKPRSDSWATISAADGLRFLSRDLKPNLYDCPRYALPGSWIDTVRDFVDTLAGDAAAADTEEDGALVDEIGERLLAHLVIPHWTDIIYIPSSSLWVDSPSAADDPDAPSNAAGGAGGIVLFEQLPSDVESRDYWQRVTLERVKYLHTGVQQVYSAFLKQDQERISRHFARGAAVAAIMSRNLSHNIGSHVSPRSTLDTIRRRLGGSLDAGHYRIAAELKRRLDELVQRKGDFLAEITTEPLTTTRSALFYREVMLPLIENTLLTDSIARNEGIGYPTSETGRLIDDAPCTLILQVRIAGRELAVAYDYLRLDAARNSKPTTVHYPARQGELPLPFSFPYLSHKDATTDVPDGRTSTGDNSWPVPRIDGDDIEVALPGPQGELAFYGLIENFVRNVAKHHRRQLDDAQGDRKLLIEVAIDEPPGRAEGCEESHYSVRLTSNLWKARPGTPEHKDLEDFKEAFTELTEQDIVDSSGKLRRGNWGLSEMRICAALLTGRADFTPETLAESLRLEWNDERNALSYEFKLLRARNVCIVWPEASGIPDDLMLGRLRGLGIWAFQSVEGLQQAVNGMGATFEFAVLAAAALDDEAVGNAFSKDLLPLLPFRVLVVGRHAPKSPSVQEMIRERAIVSAPSLEAALLELWMSASTSADLSMAARKFLAALWRVWVSERFLLPCGGGGGLLHVNLEMEDATEARERWTDMSLSLESMDWPLAISIGNCLPRIDHQRMVVFDRHGGAAEGLVNAIPPNDPAEPVRQLLTPTHSYSTLDKRSADFVRIASPHFPPETTAETWTLPWQMMEAGLLQILVVDERLAERARDPVTGGDGNAFGSAKQLIAAGPLTRRNIAAAANVYICSQLELADGTLQALHGTAAHPADAPEVVLQCLHPGVPARCYWRGEKDTAVVRHELSPDMIILHKGILDRLLREQGITSDQVLSSLRRSIPFIVVDSGRGIQDLQNGVKFIPYSLVEHHLQDRIAKLTLTSIVMGLRRRADTTNHQ
jgi:hypothetical protein